MLRYCVKKILIGTLCLSLAGCADGTGKKVLEVGAGILLLGLVVAVAVSGGVDDDDSTRSDHDHGHDRGRQHHRR